MISIHSSVWFPTRLDKARLAHGTHMHSFLTLDIAFDRILTSFLPCCVKGQESWFALGSVEKEWDSEGGLEAGVTLLHLHRT